MKSYRKHLLVLAALSLTSLTAGYSSYEAVETFDVREPMPAEIFRPTAGKRVACFITINSSDEKGVFTKYLNPAEWDLVELTAPTSNGSKNGWFGEACKKNIQCDINVISGHFAGAFFGASGYRLALSELENHSCAQDCKGVMEHPEEVYLFGCNALASKERDHRTPEEYYRVLRADGYSHETATRVVEDRYGAFGQDNRGKVQRAFSGVPYIHGFYSTSPLGKDLKPILEDYMKRLGNFTKYYDSLRTRGVSAKTEPNVALNAAMKGKSFMQCSGLDPKDPEYQFHLQICALFDKSIPLTTRLLSIELMLNSDKVLSLLPSIQNFMRSNIREIKANAGALFERLQGNQNAKKILVETATAVKSPMIKIEWMRFAHLMGWITREDLIATVFQLADSAFSGSYFEPDLGDTVCSLNVSGLDHMDFSAIVPKIKSFHFASQSAANAMSCMGLARYPAFREIANNYYKTRTSLTSSDTQTLAVLFANSSPTLSPTPVDRELLARLNNLCVTRPLGKTSPLCGSALAKLGAAMSETAPTLVNFLRAANPSMQMTYADSFRAVEASQDLIESAMIDVYLDLRHPYWYGIETYFLSRPLKLAANQKRIIDYLVGATPGRRPDEMIYSLREMRMTPAEVDALFAAVRGKTQTLITSAVFSGYLHLANNAGSTNAFIEKLFKQHEQVSITNDRDLKAFYEALALPKVKAVIRTSETAKQAICMIMKSASQNLGFDDYGDVVAREIPVKTCAELTEI